MSILLSPSPLGTPLASPAPRHSTSPAAPKGDLLRPSPLQYPAIAAHLPPDSSLARRPRLSLSTASCLRTLGRGTTGLRLDTTHVTPTYTNTYQNTFERGDIHHDYDARIEARTPSFCEGMRDTVAPYTRTPTLRSALKNGPILSFHNSAARGKKIVSFSDTPEEIHTTVYQLRHSDIPPSSPSTGVILASGQKHALSPSSINDSAYTLASSRHADGHHEGLVLAQTPTARRHKRIREWVWTLGESDDTMEQTSITVEGTAQTSDMPRQRASGADNVE